VQRAAPVHNNTLNNVETTGETTPSPEATDTSLAGGEVERASTPGEGLGSRQENGTPDEGPKSPQAQELFRALYGREGETENLCAEAWKFRAAIYRLVGRSISGQCPIPWGTVLEIAGDVRERHHASGGRKPHHRASAFLALVALAIEGAATEHEAAKAGAA
jgi:hypothetical protein